MESLFRAVSLLGSGLDGLSSPLNYSFWTLIGDFFVNLPRALLNLIWSLIYVIIRFVLNIVDFLQYFAKKLVGLDYWMQGKVSADTVKDSDVIFRFLFNSTVQRVFKYLIGIFAVLLIVFTIVAIVKSEYAYVTDEKNKVDNSKTNIFKRALKAIALVVLFPIMIVMGILASNAILASLVNAFNINNNLTLGGQIFTASAYDANRYRQYAGRGTRYAGSNTCYVEAQNASDGRITSILVPTTLPAITPTSYKSSHKFTGFGFTYGGKDYLYQVDPEELAVHYNHYYTYLTQCLGATIIQPAALDGSTFSDGAMNMSNVIGNAVYAVEVSLHAQGGGSRANQAAYNTWKFNEILSRDNISFDQTLTKTQTTFESDAGTLFPDAYVWKNNSIWGGLHDGGQEGFVPTTDEYYVMADILDYMIGNNASMAIVNINDPLIDWKYSGNGQYLDAKFVHGITSSNKVDSFLVDYNLGGKRVYTVKANATREDQGAIYIMAYYNASTNRYVPVVNGKTYVDNNGNAHAFKSSYLSSTYAGLIVARGLINGSYYNSTGIPSIISSSYHQDETGNLVGLSDPYYVDVNSSSDVKSWAEKIVDADFSLNTSFNGLDIVDNNSFITSKYINGLDKLASYIENESERRVALQTLAKSLPRSMNIKYLNVGSTIQDNTLTDLNWTFNVANSSIMLGSSLSGVAGETRYYVFMATDDSGNAKKINVHVDNIKFAGNTITGDAGVNDAVSDATIKQVPLYALVSVTGDQTNGFAADIYYVYSQFENSTINWFSDLASVGVDFKGVTQVIGDCIYGDYSPAYNTVAAQGRDDLKARILYGYGAGDTGISAGITTGNIAQSEGSKTVPISRVASLSYSSIAYLPQAQNLNDTSGIALNVRNAMTTTVSSSYATTGGTANFSYGRITASLLKLMPLIDGSILNPNGTVTGTGVTFNGGHHFAELPSSRIEYSNGNVTYYFGLYNEDDTLAQFNFKDNGTGDTTGTNYNIVVRLEYNAADGSIRATADDYYTMNITGFGGTPNPDAIKIGSTRLLVKTYDMEYVSTNNIGGTNYITYRYNIYSQYYYFIFAERVSTKSNQGTYVNLDSNNSANHYTEMIKIDINLYNVFVFNYNGVLYQYNPETRDFKEAGAIQPLETMTYYVRSANVTFDHIVNVNTAGHNIFEGYIYAEDGATSNPVSGTILAQMYYEGKTGENAVASKTDALNSAYQYSLLTGTNIGTYVIVPYYSNSPSLDTIKNRFMNAGTTVEFLKIDQNKYGFKLDFCFNPLSWFTEGPLWRFKLGFFNVAERTEEEAIALAFENGIMSLDYNFNSVNGMSMSSFFEPGKINVLILVFASILVFIVIGQAIWGLIARIYDITLYFIVMPGVVSTLPLGDDTMYNNWKQELVKKVLSAYGVMIGLNFFFILIPAIRDASQIFTPADLELNIAQGSWLSFLTADAVNNLIYLLFLLVAFTLIKTLPKTIAGIIGAEDVYSNGADVKQNVSNTVREVGSHVSGQSALKAVDNVFGEKGEDGKRHGGMLRNFVPGSAVYNSFKAKMKGKKKDEEGEESSAADSSAEASNSAAGNEVGEAIDEAMTGGTEQTATEAQEVAVTAEAPEAAAEGTGVEAATENAAPATEEQEAPSMTRAERELAELQAERDANLAAQEGGQGDVHISRGDREAAIRDFNAAADTSIDGDAAKIFDERDDSILDAAFEDYKKATGVDLSTMSSADKGYRKMRKEALDNYRDKLAVESWNKNAGEGLRIHTEAELAARDKELENDKANDAKKKRALEAKLGSGTITAEEKAELAELNKKKYTNTMREENERNIDAARRAFDAAQDAKLKNAAFAFNNKKLDEKIAKKEQEVALEKAGLTNLSGQSFFHRNRRSSEDVGRHLAEQTAAHEELDAIEKSAPVSADSLSSAQRQKLVAEFNKGKKKGNLFSDLSAEEQKQALNGMLASKHLEEVTKAKARAEKADAEVEKDSFIVDGKFSGRRYKKFKKLQETLDTAEVAMKVETPKDLAQKLVQMKQKSDEAEKNLNRTNARNHRKQLEDLDKVIANGEKTVAARNEAYRQALNKQKAAKTDEEKKAAKREVEQTKKDLDKAQKIHNDRIAERNSKAKQVADEENDIKKYKELKLNVAERNEGILRNNFVKNREKLAAQLEQFGDKLTTEQRNELVERIAKKDEMIGKLDQEAAQRRAGTDVKYHRFRKFKMTASEADEVAETTDRGLAKKRSAKNAEEAKTAKTAERLKRKETKEAAAKAKQEEKDKKAQEKRAKEEEKAREKAREKIRNDFGVLVTNPAGAKALQQGAKIGQIETASTSAEERHNNRLAQIRGSIDIAKSELNNAMAQLQSNQSEYERLFMEDPKNKELGKLKRNISVFKQTVESRTERIRSLEAAETREDNIYNRFIRHSYANRVNRRKRKQIGAIDSEEERLRALLNRSKGANGNGLSPEQEAVLATRISQLQAVKNELGGIDRYKRTKRAPKKATEFTQMSVKQQNREYRSAYIEAHKAAEQRRKNQENEAKEARATARTGRKKVVEGSKFSGVTQTREAREAEIKERQEQSKLRTAETIERTTSHINAGNKKIQTVVDAKRANAIASAMVNKNKAGLLNELIKKGVTPEAINKAGLSTFIKHQVKSGAIDSTTAKAIAAEITKKGPKITNVSGKNVVINNKGKVDFAKGQKIAMADAARKAYQEAITKTLKKGGQKPPKTAGMARRMAKGYEKRLVEQINQMTDQKLKAMSEDQRAESQKLKAQMQAQLKSLRAAEASLKKKAKRMNTDINKIIRESRSKKYGAGIPQIAEKKPPNPQDENK